MPDLLKSLLFAIISISYIAYSNTLMLILDRNKDSCISKEILSGDTLKISYMVSGNEDEEGHVKVNLIGPHERVYLDNTLENGSFKKSGEFEMNAPSEGVYRLCFNPGRHDNVIVSFEIYTMNESGHILSLAKDGK